MALQRFFVHAPNVHQGGGKSLLVGILNNLPSFITGFLSIDSRMSMTNEIPDNFLVKRITPSILKRFCAEKWLSSNVSLGDIVFCFGNLPPLFRLDGHVVVFIQNRYLIDDVKLKSLHIKTKFRIMVERVWLFSRISNVDEFIVQTPSMKNILEARIKNKIPVTVMPFIEDYVGYERTFNKSKVVKRTDFDFLYVASGEPHKNHRVLVEAWKLLASEGIYPSLKLTLDREDFSDLCDWVNQQAKIYQLNLENKGTLTRNEVNHAYKNTGALIYPSTLESFGLPLIEARQAGIPVIASELDYVRDLLDPEYSFDPNSAISIARAVKRFLRLKEPILPLSDPAGFIEYLISKGE